MGSTRAMEADGITYRADSAPVHAGAHAGSSSMHDALRCRRSREFPGDDIRSANLKFSPK